MNAVHFRKPMRIALIIIAALLLLDFFAYYLPFTNAHDNKQVTETLRTAAEQRTLGQRICNTSLLLLLNNGLSEGEMKETRQNLTNAIAVFETRQQALLRQVNPASATPTAADVQLKNEINNNAGSFLATAKEIAGADNALLVTNGVIYTNRMRHDAASIMASLDDLSRQYLPLLLATAQKNRNIQCSQNGFAADSAGLPAGPAAGAIAAWQQKQFRPPATGQN